VAFGDIPQRMIPRKQDGLRPPSSYDRVVYLQNAKHTSNVFVSELYRETTRTSGTDNNSNNISNGDDDDDSLTQ